MLRREIVICLLTLVLFSAAPAYGQNDRFQSLLDLNGAIVADETIKKNLDDLVKFAQDFSTRGWVPYSVMKSLLQAYLLNLSYLVMDGKLSLEDQKAAHENVDAILGTQLGWMHIAEYPDIDPPPVPENGCRVRILAYRRNELHEISDGRFETWLEDAPFEFVAEASPGGGTFSWAIPPSGIAEIPVPARLSLRLPERGSHSIRVGYRVGDARCADWVSVVAQ